MTETPRPKTRSASICREIAKGLLVMALLLPGAGPTSAELEATGESAKKAASESAEPKAEKRPRPTLYIPPPRGRAHTRSGGGTRSIGEYPVLSVIAPEHEGLTTRAHPTLYWYISQATDVRIDLTLLAEEGVEPLLEQSVKAPVAKGFHPLRLSELGLELEEGMSYAWFVSLVPDPENRSADLVSGGVVRRVARSEVLTEALEAADTSYAAYAANGIWYDAISELARALESSPGDPLLRAQRAAFLEQVDLLDAAAYSDD